VAPGHFVLVRGARVSTHKYWDFDYPEAAHLRATQSEQAYIGEFRELLSEAVKLRLRADVPVGVYLSGGIDSSVVLGLMREHSASPLDAFTLSFDHEHYDEGAIAREMAAYAGVRHTVIDIDANELAANFEATVWHDECPFSNGNTIAKYVLSRHVRDAGLKVVLTGEGSDEILGGYSHFLGDMRVHNSRAFLRRIARQVRWVRQSLGRFKPGAALPAERLPEFRAARDKLGFVPAQMLWTRNAASTCARLRGPALAGFDHCRRFESLMNSLEADQVSGRDPLNQALYVSSKSTLPNRILTTLGDRVEMAHSIEARLPFLDHKVVEYLTRVPVELKIKVQHRGGIEKYLLKEAARGRVTETLYRRTKHPFTAPPTVTGSADAMAELVGDILHGSDLRDLGLYDQAAVLKLHDESKASHRGYLSGMFLHIAGLAVMRRKFGLSVA